MQDLEQNSNVSFVHRPERRRSTMWTKCAGWFVASTAYVILLLAVVVTRDRPVKITTDAPASANLSTTTVYSKASVSARVAAAPCPIESGALLTGFPFVNVSSTFPLGLCKGHCRINDDCAEGLICFGRDSYHPVPGCIGGAQDASKTNYCVFEIKPPVAEVNRSPLGLCQGDCDDDSDCENGLICFQRGPYQEVPGCFGGNYDASRTDYCVDANAQTLNPQPSPVAPSIPPVKTAGIFADPHVTTWQSGFSYQGACDLVLVATDSMEIHVRTTHGPNRHFSSVSTVAVKLGGDVLEVRSDKSYFINGQLQLNAPNQLGGFPFSKGLGFSIDLGDGQSIRIRFFVSTMEIKVTGNGNVFGESKGLVSSYYVDKAVFRDGSQRVASADEIAKEWIVDQSKGDGNLFLETAPHQGCIEAAPFQSSSQDRAAAEIACARLSGDQLQFNNCIFDVLASGDSNFASNPAFDPQPDVPFCSNENKCLIGTLLSSGKCSYVPVTCSDPSGNTRCDPLDGVCKSQSDLAPCIAVIDESSKTNSYITNKWAEFRSLYPRRPFCLLRPVPTSSGGLFLPDAFKTDPLTRYHEVTRDGQYNVPVSDWYELCGIDEWKDVMDFVAVFIDNSGSLYSRHVQGSIDLLVEKMETSGLAYRTLTDPNEDWVNLFITELN